jgi:DNA-binding transcriptional LysR family regulator
MSARAMLDEAEAIGATTKNFLAEPRGNLRIAAPVILGKPLWVTPQRSS